MNRNSSYTLLFGSLSEGQHDFTFELSGDFFALFSESEIRNGDCKVVVILKKHSTFLEMNIDIKGEVVVECDRCLENLPLVVDFESLLVVKFSHEIDSQEFEINATEEDVIWLNPSEKELDMSQYFFDSVALSLPISRIHPDDESGNSTCDKDMIDRFIASK